MKLNDKCLFDVHELSFLGHVVSANGIQPISKNLKQIDSFAQPSNVSQLRSFLGLVEYYSKFIPHLAEIVEPMRKLLRKNHPFVWDKEIEDSFQRVKALLHTAPVLSLFDPSLPVIVATDASDYGIGAVLQQQDGHITRTIQYASRTLTPAERKYSAGEKEALACLWACEKWHSYLWGRRFTLTTDHQALVTLLSSKGSGRRPLRIGRWSARLLNYTFDVQYRKGDNNKVADALSRNPQTTQIEETSFEEQVIATVDSFISKEEVQEGTAQDPVLSEVTSYLTHQWPPKRQLSQSVRPYFEVRHEL